MEEERRRSDSRPEGPASGDVPFLRPLEQLDEIRDALPRRAAAEGAFVVWRAQTRELRRVVVRSGRVEESTASTVSGTGIHVFTQEGSTALGSRDDLAPEPAWEVLNRTFQAARSGGTLGLDPVEAVSLEATRARIIPEAAATLDRLDLAEVARRLLDLETEIGARVPGARLGLSFSADLDAWRVFRSDGTDALFAMPRATLRVAATPIGADARHTVAASVASPSAHLPWDGGAVSLFLRRAEAAARLCLELPGAAPHPAGTFPIVIDYALAKGLAHEAFGHGAEADGYRSSVLARDGRLRAGENVGASHVSVVDEPIPGDHGWQPISSNGVPRARAVLVDRGVLRDGLSDPWSAGPGGVRLTGAGRAEWFHCAPLPRMSNIRIEVEEPLPAPGSFEDYGPAEVRDLLRSAGVLARHPRVAYLSGYAGGQVNVATGDFVFQCRAIHAVGRDRIALHKPAIFSGSMFGALGAIREAFGPLQLDAVGTCGKGGQSVPSSGGSHFFLVLEPDASFRLGGA